MTGFNSCRQPLPPYHQGLISMQDLIDIEDAYNALFFFEFCLRAWAADFKKDFWTNPVTAVDFLATIPPVISFFGFTDRASPLFRFLRLLRVLRLLRLLDRSPNSVLFGLVRSDSMSIQLVGIGAEFICIFVIAAGVIYDLEYEINPNVNNLNDTLYWAILTLTGIGRGPAFLYYIIHTAVVKPQLAFCFKRRHSPTNELTV